MRSFAVGFGLSLIAAPAYTIATINAFTGAVVKNVTTGPYAIANLKFDTQSRKLYGVYQHDGALLCSVVC